MNATNHNYYVPEGTLVVTVGRDGSKTASCGNGISVAIYCTKVYRAKSTKDGRVTWRLVRSLPDTTSGRSITAPMKARAQKYAREWGIPYADGIGHGQPAYPLENESCLTLS